MTREWPSDRRDYDWVGGYASANAVAPYPLIIADGSETSPETVAKYIMLLQRELAAAREEIARASVRCARTEALDNEKPAG